MASEIHAAYPDVFSHFEWVDIDKNEVLKKQYNEMVPVLKMNDEIIFFHFYDAIKFKAIIAA